VPGNSRLAFFQRCTVPVTLTQDGDDEGILRLDRLPTPAEAEAIRDVIGIRRRRHMTDEALANLERARSLLNRPQIAAHAFAG
jgi:hypothetical protein